MTRMLKIAIVAALLSAGFLILAGVVWTANAQTNIELRESNARSDFPNGFVFNMTVEAAAGLDEVRLVYEIAPDGVRATAVPACTEGQIASCRFELGANARTLLIPSAEVTYFWRITSGGMT
ncbi:MAG: hypothetical protein IIB85_03055, partial [Chloroflexi bacterium]|nr:hypothetical protein [Chloroflexota bacterium]